MLQKTFLASDLEYVDEPCNLHVISCNFRAFWISQIMALLRSFRSGYIFGVLLAMWRYVSKLTKVIGSTFGVMASCIVTSLSCVLISSLASTGTWHLTVLNWWNTGIKCDGVFTQPITYLVKVTSGNMFFRSSMLWMVLWSSNGGIVALWSLKG